jgi:hypothetical protein
MKDAIDAVFSVITVLAMTFGAGYGLRRVGIEIKMAALEKAQHGLAPLIPFTRKLTGRRR